MDVIGIVVPTVAGRAADVENCIASHTEDPRVAYVVEMDHKTCGEAWNAGAKALYEGWGDELTHLMFTADDLIAHKGWLDAALETCRVGRLPAPVLYNPDGTVWVGGNDGGAGALCGFSRVPFFPMEKYLTMGLCPPIHYMSDCYYGDAAAHYGYRFQVTPGYAFTHTWAQVGRHTDDLTDRVLYDQARAEL